MVIFPPPPHPTHFYCDNKARFCAVPNAENNSLRLAAAAHPAFHSEP